MIYLIRHGIAQSYSTSDFERELTTEGIIKLRAAFIEFREKFKSSNYKIYSSPTVRTVQTAEILCEMLKSDFEIVDELKDESYVDFIKQLDKNADHIIVGHEPYISDAIYKLSGKKVIVSRGTIHKLEV